MKGLKNVRNRHTDALTQVSWDQLESLLAVYYRGQGYAVEHCGTGATGARFDGGIDLKLRKNDAYILVQCKHWNAKQVPHNDVHQLIGLMVNEGATGAILVTSGEFTRAAIDAALKQGHVQLVDGDDLRAMLAPLPDPTPTAVGMSGSRSLIAGAASTVGERLLSAAEDRIRHGAGAPRTQRRRGTIATAMGTGLWLLALKLLFALAIFLILTNVIQSALAPIMGGGRTVQPSVRSSLPVPQEVGRGGVLHEAGNVPSRHVIDRPTHTTINERPSGIPADTPPSEEQMREAQRRADEAARIIEASTPEM